MDPIDPDEEDTTPLHLIEDISRPTRKYTTREAADRALAMHELEPGRFFARLWLFLRRFFRRR